MYKILTIINSVLAYNTSNCMQCCYRDESVEQDTTNEKPTGTTKPETDTGAVEKVGGSKIVGVSYELCITDYISLINDIDNCAVSGLI